MPKQSNNGPLTRAASRVKSRAPGRSGGCVRHFIRQGRQCMLAEGLACVRGLDSALRVDPTDKYPLEAFWNTLAGALRLGFGSVLSLLFQRGFGRILAIASAAADSPLIRASAEVDRSLRYHRASDGCEAIPSGFSTLSIVSSLRADDWCKKSAARRRSLPIQRAINAILMSASRSPLGPLSIRVRLPFVRYRWPSSLIRWFTRLRDPTFP